MATHLIKTSEDIAPHGVRWLILTRLMVIIISICTIMIRTMAHPSPIAGMGSVLLLLLALMVLDIGYLLILPLISGGMALFVAIQFLIDVCVVTGLIFFTGGVNSNFVYLYFISIMASAMLLSRKNSALFASLATVGIAVITTMYLTHTGMELVSPIYRPAGEEWMPATLSRMLAIATAFFLVAYLSGVLSEHLNLAKSVNEEVLQNMAEGVAVFDNSMRVVFVNSEFESIFSPNRPIQLGDLADAIFSTPHNDVLKEIVKSGKSTRFELEEIESDTATRPPLEIRTSLLGNPASPRGLVMLAIDLSLRKRAENAELRAERFSAVTEMAAGLAHEIRNPLASVRGSVQEISRDFDPGSPNHRLAQIVMRESDRLDGIITHFLQYARQRPLRPVKCRLDKMIRELGMLLGARNDTHNIEIRIDCPGESVVVCDQAQINEVLLNLGVNAISSMDGEGTLSLCCPVRGTRPPGTTVIKRGGEEKGVCLCISDTGRGLPPGAEERIFEPFYTTKQKGSGLGLSIASRVIQSHEGVIWAENNQGKGCSFYIWLPVSGPFRKGAPQFTESGSENK